LIIVEIKQPGAECRTSQKKVAELGGDLGVPVKGRTDDAPRRRAFDQYEKRAHEKRERAEGLYLNGKRDSEWFDQIDSEVTGELETIAAKQDSLRPLGPDANDLGEAVRTLQNLREELPHCLPEYRAQFMHALGIAIIGENGVEMAYYPEVAAVLGSARLLPKTSVTRAKAVTRPALNVASEMRTTSRGCGSNACRSFRSRETNVPSRPKKRLTSVT
jgi:hypothetical protein